MHVTIMIDRLLQQPGMHMKSCLGKVDEDTKIYQDLFDRRNVQKVEKKDAIKT